MYAEKVAGGIIDLDGWYSQICCHSGRTDSGLGHNDYRNASALGPYHWHHGEGPHLHPHKTSGESLIDLLKSYNGSVFTTTKSSSGNTTYAFESIIELEKNKKYFTFEITGKDDAFYLIGDGERVLVESFWGTGLNPFYIIRKGSPWNGAAGGLDYLANGEYFKAMMKKYCGLEGSGEVSDKYFASDRLKIRATPNGQQIDGDRVFVKGAIVKIHESKEMQKVEGSDSTWIKVYYDVSKVGWTAKELLEELPRPTAGHNFQYNWDKSQYVSQDFKDKAAGVAKSLGIDPDDLMAVMAFESYSNPAQKNMAGGSAIGLV